MSRLDVTLKGVTERFGDGTVEASSGMMLRGRHEWERVAKGRILHRGIEPRCVCIYKIMGNLLLPWTFATSSIHSFSQPVFV